MNPSYQQFDPRGIQQAPQYQGPMAAAGTIYNPAGPAGMPAVRGQPGFNGTPQFEQTHAVYAPSGGIVGYMPGGSSGTTQRPGGSTNPLLSMLMGGQQQAGGYQTPNPFTRTGGSYAPAAQQGTGTQINTSIQPQNIYTGQQSQEAANQAFAANSAPLPWLQQRYAGNGVNVNSPSAINRALPAYTSALAQGQQATAQIPFQDTTADAQHYLSGQVGREGEAQDWARIASSANSTQNNYKLNTLQSLLGLLTAF